MPGESSLEELWFTNRDIRLHAVAAGPRNGPVVILLHGFPEFWYGWQNQIGPLADAGFRVIAPDQRGYNISSKPRGITAYKVSELTSDVIAIIDQLGKDRVCAVGHDWGATIAWSVAIQHADRVIRLAILNVPHPAVLERNVRTNPRQWLRSWYGLFFQIPRLPEFLISANGFWLGKRSLILTSRPGTFAAENLARHVEAWSQPGAMTAMLNWYRALFWFAPKFADPQVHMPTHILWGKKDAFLLAEEAQESVEYCAEGKLTYFPDATHWLQHEEPERMNELLIEFFSQSA
jgi:pimeloyl-ACP methyl ester carboxylesterase